MSTRSENARSEQQRKSSSTKRAKKAKSNGANGAHGAHDAGGQQHHANAKSARKATYALETHTPGKRPSRKSTRKSANRSKPDTNLELRAQRKKNSPEGRYGTRGG
jgi:hypothetical protein